jgi:hypothetical protein
MLKNYLEDLEEMSERNAEFTEYYHKLLNGIDDLKGNDKPLFVYSLMNAIRDIGYENGKRAANEAMKKFLNCS